MRISSDYAKPRVSFKGYIIDTHLQQVPKGSLLSNKEFPANALDSFVKNSFTVFVNQNYRTDSVKKALISNFEGIAWAEKQKNEVLNSGRSKIDLKPEEIQFSKNEIEANMAMINEYKDSDFYKIVAVCQPSKTNGKANNIRNIINQNKDTIFGLKFNPQELQLNANSKLYDDYLKLAEEKGMSPEEALGLEAEKVSVGSDGLMTVLNWLANVDARYQKGIMIGFDGRHTRGHIYRSILEAVAMTMKGHVSDMCNEVGTTIEKLIITGGGSNSDLFMQIFADVFNIPVVRNEVNGAAGLGSAICAAVAANVYDSFESAVEHMVRIKDTFTPIAENAEIYSKMIPVYSEITKYTDPILKKSYEIFD